jgi:hypothetical protein
MGRFCDLPYKNLSPSELAGVFLIEHHIILQKKFSEDWSKDVKNHQDAFVL